MKPKLHPQDLLVHLEKFVRQMHSFGLADNPKLVLKTIMGWTKGQPLLTKKLLEYSLQTNQKIEAGKEAIAIEKIVRNRLVKDFKQDELTLEIRKILYRQDLETIYKQSNSYISDKRKADINNIQRELGLSDRQCHKIKKQYRLSDLKTIMNDTDEVNSNQLDSFLDYASEQKTPFPLCELVCELDDRPKFESPKQQSKKNVWLRNFKRYIWLLPPAFLLFMGSLNWQKGSKVITLENFNQKQDACIDSTSRSSPRMSLGEKLLTPEHQNLESRSMIALFKGVAAFARCEFPIAKKEFQESLAINKNNPEALIYLNNTEALADEHLKIAVSVPLGSKPDIAHEILRGVAQAQAEVNKQAGIRKKSLVVQVVNDDNNPQIVSQLAQELAVDSSVLAVVGHNSSNSSLAGAKVYQRNGLPMISPTSLSTELSGIGTYILRTPPSMQILANALANYAAVNSFANVAICFDSGDSASNSFVKEFQTEMVNDGGKIMRLKCDFSQTGFNPKSIVDLAISQDANALLLAPSVNDLSMAGIMAQANKQRLPLLGSPSLYTFSTIQSGKAIAGMVIPTAWLPDENPDNSFNQSTVKYWGGKVNWRTAMAFDATNAIIKGLQESSTRSELQAVLTEPNFTVDGVTGKFGFENGDRNGIAQLIYVTKSKNNRDQYHFSLLDLDNKINP